MSMQSSILTIFLSTLFITQSSSQSLIPTEPTFYVDVCDPGFGNYTSNSTYETNLKTMLTSLEQQATASPFYHTSAGSGADTVYGQYYCRADIDTNLCNTCIQQAADAILRNCSNFRSAIMWYDICTLRYHNESMFGLLSNSWVGYGQSVANVTDPDSFALVLNSTLDRLINESAYTNDYKRLGIAEVAVSSFETTYFLVQCSPDLNATECAACLWISYDYIPRCCGNWPVRARVFFPSCQLRYSDLQFYYSQQSPQSPLAFSPPPPPTSESPPPPPPPTSESPPPPPAVTTPSPAGTSTGSSGRVKVGVAATAAAAALLTLLVNI